jgi:hypothetical protein
LEVLILIDFKSLFPEVLILVKLKSWRINEMREIENFLEVLIPEELSGTKCTNGWISAGVFASDSRTSALRRGTNGRGEFGRDKSIALFS